MADLKTLNIYLGTPELQTILEREISTSLLVLMCFRKQHLEAYKLIKWNSSNTSLTKSAAVEYFAFFNVKPMNDDFYRLECQITNKI